MLTSHLTAQVIVFFNAAASRPLTIVGLPRFFMKILWSVPAPNSQRVRGYQEMISLRYALDSDDFLPPPPIISTSS